MNPGKTPDVGGRIRRLRLERKLSLRALAARSKLSVNAINRIERGDNSPTVSSLHLIATALSVPITDFFEDRKQEKLMVFVPRDARHRYEFNGIEMESLGSGLPDQKMEPFFVQVEGNKGNRENPISHPGQEFVYCIAGEIDYCVGDAIIRLHPGDSLMLDASQPHCFENPLEDPSTFLIVYQASRGIDVARREHLNL